MVQGVSADIESIGEREVRRSRAARCLSSSATRPNWFDVAGGDITSGRNFTESEYEAGAPVVLVNDKVVERLFNGEEAVGKDIRLNGELFTVIGVYNPIPNVFDSGDKGKLIVPITTAQHRLNVSLYWMQLTVKPRDGVDRDAAMDETIATLRASRHLRPGQTNDFFTNTPEKLLALYNKIVGVFFLVMIVLSAIGLLVGGVGVVAIMMISVTERTREIGVRKALGATRRADPLAVPRRGGDADDDRRDRRLARRRRRSRCSSAARRRSRRRRRRSPSSPHSASQRARRHRCSACCPRSARRGWIRSRRCAMSDCCHPEGA